MSAGGQQEKKECDGIVLCERRLIGNPRRREFGMMGVPTREDDRKKLGQRGSGVCGGSLRPPARCV